MLSPMMEQYLKTKEEYDDCILFYRLGDFYEIFFDDAIIVSKLCELVLTSKACGNNEKAPMCGIPFHALDSYLAQLVSAGYKIAIAEQMADPSTIKKGLVPRDVIRIVTPGTVTSSTLSEKDNNYIMAFYFDSNGHIDTAWCDLSTGEFKGKNFSNTSSNDEVVDLLTLIRPSEIITNVSQEDKEWLWDYAENFKVMMSTANKRIVFESNAPSLLMSYLRDTQKQDINHLERLDTIDDNSFMRLDHSTLKNLELTEPIFAGNDANTLISVLDKCKTAMGSRRLKQWIKEPLISKQLIDSRLDAVEELFKQAIVRNNIRALMTSIYDLERLISRVSLGRASIKDLLALKHSITTLPDIKAEMENFAENEYFRRIDSKIDDLQDIYELLDSSIFVSSDDQDDYNGIIKPGFSEELDEIYSTVNDSLDWLKNLEENEKEQTGIKNLKVGNNKVFGYYIEVPKSKTSLVPDDYIRKQTTKTSERYVTNKLKEIENIVLSAQSKIDAIEKKLLDDIRESVQNRTDLIQKTAIGLSILDVICTLAEVSSKNGYVKPVITDDDEILIDKGRHPVVELDRGRASNIEFVANDLFMNNTDSSLLLITGPNMSGKSTYMRQLSLIVIMAQMGCFVPADKATIGICDRIYTRIGSADNISMGQSTFFVEMIELANILNTATSKSLVILDEIGRGTSTFDGLSIAWSTVEFLTDAHIRTMFATHYHELTTINTKGIKNLNVEVKEDRDSIDFTYNVSDGPASQSYGIQVAKLAGVPNSVLERASEILVSLESNSKT